MSNSFNLFALQVINMSDSASDISLDETEGTSFYFFFSFFSGTLDLTWLLLLLEDFFLLFLVLEGLIFYFGDLMNLIFS